ncbi:MAG TPA: polyprenyl synthetase family protein [Planctomycetota bacterium]|nr:polyprenyl synthetase family protein [Planctomycetota bacterium]
MIDATTARALEKALDRHLPSRGVPARLQSAMRYTLFNAGKRIRPALTLLVCQDLGGDLRQALPSACAVEYIHTYSLIHDDLPAMDDDDFRRGKPSSHKKFDEATAILAGDALLTAAFEAIARTPDQTLIGPMTLALAEGAGAAGMVGGQQIDLAPRADVHEIHAKKTAALFQASCHLGALAARSSKAGNLARYGLKLGLAFQAVDDILDASEEGRRNVARIYGLKKAQALAAQEVAAAKAAVRFMGVKGERLRQIADFVLSRKH